MDAVEVLDACETEKTPVVTLLESRNRVAICCAASFVTGVQVTILFGAQVTLLIESNVAPVLLRVKVPFELVCPLASCWMLRARLLG